MFISLHRVFLWPLPFLFLSVCCCVNEWMQDWREMLPDTGGLIQCLTVVMGTRTPESEGCVFVFFPHYLGPSSHWHCFTYSGLHFLHFIFSYDSCWVYMQVYQLTVEAAACYNEQCCRHWASWCHGSELTCTDPPGYSWLQSLTMYSVMYSFAATVAF